jgi:tetratricopeptide (TPR) repeat protein
LAVHHATNQTRFCLCIDGDSAEAASGSANDGIPSDIDTRWDREVTLRRRFWDDIKELDLDVEVMRTALETLVSHLEPTEGNGLCSVIGPSGSATASANALYPLIQSWTAIDSAVATKLLEDALSRLPEDGSMPAAPSANSDSSEPAAWPMLAQTCALYEASIPGSEVVARNLSRLERHLVRTIKHFDPTDRGLPTWSSAAECFIPDTFDEHVASASLAAMLLNEIEAFHTLCATHPDAEHNEAFLENERDRLRANLSTILWNAEIGMCHDRYIDGDPIGRATLSGVLPVGVRDLPELIRRTLLHRVQEPAYFGGGNGLALWQHWETDETAPRAPCAHQLFLLPELAKAQGSVAEVEDQCTEAIVRWFAARGALPIELRNGTIEAEDPATPYWFEYPLLAACLALRTLPATARRQNEAEAPGYLVALDNHRYAILIAVIALVVGVLAVAMLGERRKPRQVEEEVGTVQLVINLMSQGNYETARARLDDIKNAPNPPDNLPILEGNLLFREGRYADARAFFQQCIDEEIAVQQASMNLALSFYHDRQLREAVAQYQKVIEEFADSDPRLTKLAETAIRIIKTHGDSLLPPESGENPPEATD